MTVPAITALDSLPPQSLGAWLRSQRLEHKWSIAEMARRLHKAAKAADDNTVMSASIVATYVRRWERDKIAPAERYRLHYCAVLGIPFSQFGPGITPGPDHHSTLPASGPGENGRYVLVVIPDGCRRVVINMPGAVKTGGLRKPRTAPVRPRSGTVRLHPRKLEERRPKAIRTT